MKIVTICDLNGRIMYSEHLLTLEESKNHLNLQLKLGDRQLTSTEDQRGKVRLAD